MIVRNRKKKRPQAKRTPAGAIDPTRTVTLRLAAVRAVRKKFALLKGRLVALIVGEDAFGLKERKDLKFNSFCPTGEGGGVDPSCSPGGIPSLSDLVAGKGHPSGFPEPSRELGRQIDDESSDDPIMSEGIISIHGLLSGSMQGGVDPKIVAKYMSKYLAKPPGLKDRISVTKFKDHYLIEDGHHRALALHYLGHKSIRAEIADISPVTTNVERIDMPQIRKEHWQRFLRCARERTTIREESGVDPKSLRGVQSEFSQERVDAIPVEKLDYPILISQDSYVLDGNHRWIKAYQADHPLKVLRLGLDRDDALAMMREFPQTEFVENRFQFHSTPDKIAEFQKWLRQQFKSVLLGKSDEELWAEFTRRGFEKGAGRAFDDVNTTKLKRWAPGQGEFYGGSRREFLKSSFGRAESTDKLRLLSGRSFTDLRNVTEDMATRMGRTLMDGLARGANPRELVDDLVEDLGVSEARAETIARTEIIRAHAEGQLDAFEKLGVEEVGVSVEWDTAKDGRVCRHCQPLQGVVLTVEEAHGLIPNHPNCRCAFIPANVGEDDSKQVRSKAAILEAFEEAEVDPPELDDERPKSLIEPPTKNELYKFSRLMRSVYGR